MSELNRTQQPGILPLASFDVQLPQRTVMANGTKLTVIEGGEQDVFRMDILVHGGQWRQTMPLQASFTNKMLSEGSRSYSSAEISEMLDRYGAWMEQNSTTSVGIITLYSLNKYAEQTLDVIEKIVKEPVFPQKEFQVMVENARQQYLVNKEKVDTQARVAFSHLLLGDEHPCARFADIEDYARIQTANLKEFYGRHYHCRNVSIYLSGKVKKQIVNKVVARFGTHVWGLDSALVPMVPIPPVTADSKRVMVEVADAVQSAVRMGCLTISHSHPDYFRLQVLLTVLGGYFGSRLMRNIREDKGYTYGIGTGLAAYPYESVIIVATQCASAYVEPLIGEVYHEIDVLQQEVIPVEELDMVKSYMLGELIRRYESALSLSDVYIYAEVNGMKDNYVSLNLESIRNTTGQDVLTMAQRYLQKEQIKEVIAGKKI